MKNYSETVSTARDYYNSNDADNFYYRIWGGEDIHVGIYSEPGESVRQASQRTVERMVSKLNREIVPGIRVLDIGSGYGGVARYLAKMFGCNVTALNLSEVENRRHRQMNEEQGVADLIEVIDGSFEDLPFPEANFDVVWSQDAICHSENRRRVVQEVVRVLDAGGQFVFTDILQADDCPDGVLQPILDRIHLTSLGSPSFYRSACEAAGLHEVSFQELTHYLIQHYERISKEMANHSDSLHESVSGIFIENMLKGLGHWVEGGKKGYLVWGIFVYEK